MPVRKLEDIPKYEPELTFQEIADILGLSNQAVFETYTRAIIKLRKIIKEEQI